MDQNGPSSTQVAEITLWYMLILISQDQCPTPRGHDALTTCFGCGKTQKQLSITLKPCAKCRKALYCSRKCQNNHWKHHKKTCAVGKGSAPAKPDDTNKSRLCIKNPFVALFNKNWIQERSEEDVYHLLYAIFRLRLHDVSVSLIDEKDGYPAGREASDFDNFRLFLNRATTINARRVTREKALPRWWSDQSIQDCLRTIIEAESIVYDVFLDECLERFFSMSSKAIIDMLGPTDPADDAIDDLSAQIRMVQQLCLFGAQVDGISSQGDGRNELTLASLAISEVGMRELLEPENRQLYLWFQNFTSEISLRSELAEWQGDTDSPWKSLMSVLSTGYGPMPKRFVDLQWWSRRSRMGKDGCEDKNWLGIGWLVHGCRYARWDRRVCVLWTCIWNWFTNSLVMATGVWDGIDWIRVDLEADRYRGCVDVSQHYNSTQIPSSFIWWILTLGHSKTKTTCEVGFAFEVRPSQFYSLHLNFPAQLYLQHVQTHRWWKPCLISSRHVWINTSYRTQLLIGASTLRSDGVDLSPGWLLWRDDKNSSHYQEIRHVSIRTNWLCVVHRCKVSDHHVKRQFKTSVHGWQQKSHVLILDDHHLQYRASSILVKCFSSLSSPVSRYSQTVVHQGHIINMSPIEPSCDHCHKSQIDLVNPLKVCAKCKCGNYCSRECQTKEWKTHKKTCGKNSSESPNPSTSAWFKIDGPFSALQNGIWLKHRPEKDVYQILCDAFRMRQADKHALGDKAEPSIYSGGTADHELKTFKGFLKNGTEIDSHRSGKARVMPERWSEESIQKCMDFVTNGDAKVTVKTQKSDLIDFYKDEDMPMQLRMFGQFFDGHTSGGMLCGLVERQVQRLSRRGSISLKFRGDECLLLGSMYIDDGWRWGDWALRLDQMIQDTMSVPYAYRAIRGTDWLFVKVYLNINWLFHLRNEVRLSFRSNQVLSGHENSQNGRWNWHLLHLSSNKTQNSSDRQNQHPYLNYDRPSIRCHRCNRSEAI